MNSIKIINTLIVEDHPLMTLNYKNSIDAFNNDNGNKYLFNFLEANDCSSAKIHIINALQNKQTIDLVFLDISIPGDSKSGMISGEDVGVLLKNSFPDVKIIVSTSINDNFRLTNLISKITPMSVLVKTELTIDEIISTLKDVINNKKSYSPKISKIIDNLTINSQDLFDDIDRNILYEISIGSRFKEMIKLLSISKGTIEKRKKRMKEILDVESDRELILKAKEKGFL